MTMSPGPTTALIKRRRWIPAGRAPVLAASFAQDVAARRERVRVSFSEIA
jgi:hypothetical protein